jgi:hypothetical protein
MGHCPESSPERPVDNGAEFEETMVDFFWSSTEILHARTQTCQDQVRMGPCLSHGISGHGTPVHARSLDVL